MKFVLMKGQSQYGSLRLHVDQLAAALRELAHEVQVVDLAAPEGQGELQATFGAPPDCYFGIGGLGAELSSGGASVYDQLGVVYATLHVDHPVHQAPRVTAPIRRHVAFFLDRSHVQFVSAWPTAKIAQVGFLPPGANELPEPVDASDEAFGARDIPLLFTGTYRGAPQPAWAAWEASPARDLVAEVADRMAADARLPILDALKAAMAARGAQLTADLFDQLVPLLQTPQAFAEAYHRDRLLHALGAAGAPLHVYGNGWEPLAQRYPSFVYGGVGSFEETLHLLRRARLVLNTNNGFVAGGHERVFTAMCAGAAVVSDASRYYADAFKEGREIVTFAWNRLDEAPGQILELMSDTPRLAGIARGGWKRAMAEHRWSDRAARIVKAVKQAR